MRIHEAPDQRSVQVDIPLGHALEDLCVSRGRLERLMRSPTTGCTLAVVAGADGVRPPNGSVAPPTRNCYSLAAQAHSSTASRYSPRAPGSDRAVPEYHVAARRVGEGAMDNLPPPEVIAQEIVEDLEAALAEFAAIAESLGTRQESVGDGEDALQVALVRAKPVARRH